MSVGEAWCGWFYSPVFGYKIHAPTVYLHSTFTVPPIGGAFTMTISQISKNF